MSQYDRDFFQEDRWYDVYLYLLFWTCAISAFATLITEWTLVPTVMCFGLMCLLSFVCFAAEVLVEGSTAKAGGFFWMALTGYLVCKLVPIS